MVELRWFEAFPPDGLSLAQMTDMMRVLSGRPRLGMRQLQPVVVFELWLTKDTVRWLIGSDDQIARHLPGDLTAHVPGLTLTTVRSSPRKMPTTAREVRLSSMAYPLRLDTAGGVTTGLLQLRHRLGAEESIVLQWRVGPSHNRTAQPSQFTALESLGMVAPRKPGSGEQVAWRQKIAEPLFGIRGRAGAVAADPKRAAQLIGPVISALSLGSGPHAKIGSSWQSSRIARQLFQVIGSVRTWSGVVNAAELGILVGWPVEGVPVPGRNSMLGPPPRTLLVPVDKLERAKGDRLIGQSVNPRDDDAMVRLPLRSCASHVHLISPTGGGKSTLIARWCLDDIEAGRSVFVLEPKGDLVADLLMRVPAARLSDVVIIEPGTVDQPMVGINPLEGPRQDAERRADSMLHLFKSIFGSAIGPRSSDVLLHALILAARLEGGTLTDVPTILTNDHFRRRVLAKVSDPLIIGPWAAGFNSLSEQERSRVVMPILNKTRALTNRAAIRRMLGQGTPRFSLDELFSSPKIVLVGLNAGILGPETTKLLGSIILQQLWEAVQRQASVPKEKRRPVMAVVDELADFTAGLDFAEVLAKARGMNVSFTAAHQHFRQLGPNLRAALLANARSRISWRPAQEDSKALADTFGISPGILMGLPAYHAVAQVLVDNSPSAPFEVKTLPLPKPVNDPAAIRAASAERYGVDPQELDSQLIERWQGGGNTPGGDIGLTKRRRNE